MKQNLSDLEQAAVDYCRNNLQPDDVFPENDLLDWVQDNKEPDDVFSERNLREWAEDNGYSKD